METKLVSQNIFLLALFIFFEIGNAQNYESQKFVPISPEAAALSKMVNYPINYNTGIPNINISFHEISVGNLKLPIVLNYHAGGFKINEKATRVGLGWSLSCDLQITRSINGKDDLDPQGGYINNNLVKSHKTDGSNAYPFYSSLTNYDNAYDLAIGEKDAMPDKFNYKLLNKSGSFYFQKNNSGNNYTIVPVPYDNIKITWNESSSTFTIVDTDGTVYSFGVPGAVYYNDLTHSLDNLEAVKREYTNNAVTSWKCDKIVSTNNTDVIEFKYTSKLADDIIGYNDKVEFFNNTFPCSTGKPVYGSNEYPLNSTSDYNAGSNMVANIPFYQISSPKYIKYFWNKTELHVPYIDNQGVVDEIFSSNTPLSKSRSTVYGLSLSEIIFRGGKVTFSGSDQLNFIRVLNDKNIEVKSLSLFQSKKTTYIDGTPTDGTRYLDSLHVKNGIDAFQRYSLLYTSKFDYGNHLKGHDAWGYLNHKTRVVNRYVNDYLSIPEKTIIQNKFYNPDESCAVITPNVEIEIGGHDNWAEMPNENNIKQGLLKQIIYPTGGVVDFDFESNKYQEHFSSNKSTTYSQKLPQIGGGLRIRSINYLDEESNFIKQKYYRYGDLEEGTGILMTHPEQTSKVNSYYFGVESYEQKIYYLEAWNGQSSCSDPNCLDELAIETKTTYQPSSALNYTYPNGAPIYYTKVTEYQQDLGDQTGKTVYSFYDPTYFEPFQNDRNLIPNTNIPYLKTDWFMGVQKSIESYKYDSEDGYSPVNKKSFEYTRYNLQNQLKVAYVFPKSTFKIVGGNSTVSQRELYSHYYYDIISGQYGIPIGKLLLSKETDTIFEDTGVITIVKDYQYNKLPYLNPTSITTTNSKDEPIKTNYKYAYDFDGVYDQMENANMVTQLVEETSINTSKNRELSWRKIHYEYINEGSGFFAPKTIQSSFKGQSLTTDLIYNKYDLYGNVLEIIDKVGASTSYLWGYKGMYPVAELKNVPYQNISSSFTSNNTLENPSSEASILSVLESLRNTYNSSNQMINTYTYKRQVGVTSITGPNGDAMYYKYDPIGRLVKQIDNDGNILNTYKYHTADYLVNQPLFYYNYPIMRTINNAHICNADLSYNNIVPGGTYAYSSDVIANNNAEYYLDTLEDSSSDCTGETNGVVSIELSYGYLDYSGYYNEPVYNTHPTKVELDLIKDNSIVATQKLTPYHTYNDVETTSNLLVKEGEYQLSFRINANVKYDLGFITDFSITNIEMGTTEYISSGDSFYFENGKHYKINVANFR
ncbi:hypothetical protein [Sinomicrobium sp. M5D2P9]